MQQFAEVLKTETHSASNDELLAFLRSSMAEERRRIADIIASLIEVEERQLHRALACTSMFHFCVHKLGMSESEAFRRLTAARLAKHFPPLLTAIGQGRIHLSTVVLLRDLFTESNVAELIEAVSGLSKREVEALIARRAPKPDVASSIRKLPGPHSFAQVPPTAEAGVHSAVASMPPERLPAADTSTTRETGGARPRLDLSLFPPAAPPKPIPVGAQIAPLSAERHKVQFTASTNLRAKIERARSLLRHSNPDGDLAVVMERAVDLLIAKLERAKFGAITPRASKSPVAKEAKDLPRVSNRVEMPQPESAPESAQAHPAKEPDHLARDTKRRKVPPSTVREIILRDGEQCSFIGANGDRCNAVDFLEVDHEHPRSRGGGNELANLRLLCRAHNQYVAEQAFGRQFMARKRRKSKTAVRAREVPSSITRGASA